MIRLSHNPTSINRISVNPSRARTERNLALRTPMPIPKPTLAEVLDRGLDRLVKLVKNCKTII